MNNNKYYVLLKTLFIGVLMTLAMPANAAVESKDPIKLTIHDWTGQYLTTHIMGEVLKKAGYNIDYVQADYIAQFAGLESGDLHIAMEMWETTGKQAMDESLKTGKTVDFSDLDPKVAVEQIVTGEPVTKIARYARNDIWDKAEEYGALNCIECGCCSFVCPSNIPLVHWIRVAKNRIIEIKKEVKDKK